MPGMEVFTISGSSFGATAAPPVLLQNALKALGAAHGDGSLSIAVDGIIGPGTVKAVNYALKTYIGAGPVHAAGLSGRFLNATATKSDVQQYAGTLATIVTTAVKSAGGTIPDPVVSAARSHSGGGSSAAAQAAAQAALATDNTQMNPNLVWIGTGIAVLVVALGFMASRKRAA
jgi:hypothetical protein